MAKSLKDILAGKNKSKVSPPDIDDKNLYQWNGPDGVKFIKKHEVETHDYPHDAEAAFKGKKGGVDKTSKYKFQKDGVYEEASCNHTMEGTYCPMHEKKACPTEDDVNMQKKPKKDSKGREYLADKKKCMDEGRIEDDAQRRTAKELSAIAAASNKSVTKLKPGKKSYNQLKSTGSMFGGARTFAAGLAKRNIEAGAEHKSSVGKAKVGGKLKEETLDELYGKGKLKDIIAARQEKEYKAKLAYKRAENKMMDARSETGKAEKVKEKLRLRNISKPGDPYYNWAHSKNKLREEEQIDELKKPTPETALKVVNRATDRDEWSAKAANRLYDRYKKGYEPKEKKTDVKEETLDEVAPPNPKIEKWIKSNKERFVKEYGKEKGMQVLYAKAWKMHGQSESGAATETDYAGPGAAGYTTGRLDVGTL